MKTSRHGLLVLSLTLILVLSGAPVAAQSARQATNGEDIFAGMVGDYLAAPLGEAASLVVSPQPEYADGLWHVTGPDLDQSGIGYYALAWALPGDYTIVWAPGQYWTPTGPLTETLTLTQFTHTPSDSNITFFGGYELVSSLLTSVTDVPNDQGRQVRLIWDRIYLDGPGSLFPIIEYGVYRRQDTKTISSIARLDGWDFISTVPARGDAVYQFVAPTLCDSTIVDGLCTSTFMISAMTDSPLVYFDSVAMTGYSVDNLVPGVPEGILAYYEEDGVSLEWIDAPEADFQHFCIYRGSDPEFVPSAANLVYQTATSAWTDPSINPWDYYYKITSVDHSGNESEAGAPGNVSGVQNYGVPERTALLGAVPNPFNPSTKLSFEMATAGHARLKVYDPAGRLVATLVDELRDVGKHEVIWSGRDNSDRMSAAGVYLYRLEVGSFSQTKRIVLVK